MSRIYISSETLDKLSSSNDKQQYIKMLKAFDVKNQEPKIGSIKHSDNESSRDTKIKNALQVMMESLAKTRHGYTYSPQKAKELSQMLKDNKRKQQIFRLTKQSKPPRIKVIKLKKPKNPSRSNFSRIIKTTDYNDLAGEYESRQLEFGHGRAKSKEWNDEIARKFQKELKNQHKKTDWTDRFALK